MADIPDELLMRLADGEVDAPTARRVEAEAAVDPELAARLALFRRTRALAAQALAPLAEEPVPAALADRVAAMVSAHRAAQAGAGGASVAVDAAAGAPTAVFGEHSAPPIGSNRGAMAAAGGETPVAAVPGGAEVASLAAHRAQRTAAPRWQWPAALAASLLLAAATGLGGFWLGQRGGQGNVALAAGPVADATLAAALSTLPSGASQHVGAGELRLTASYRDGSADLCREAELLARGSSAVRFIACREAAGWVTRIAVAATPNDGYAPASGESPLDAWLELSAASAPLDPVAEQSALAALPPAAGESGQ